MKTWALFLREKDESAKEVYQNRKGYVSLNYDDDDQNPILQVPYNIAKRLDRVSPKLTGQEFQEVNAQFRDMMEACRDYYLAQKKTHVEFYKRRLAFPFVEQFYDEHIRSQRNRAARMAEQISPKHRKLALLDLGQFCEDKQKNLFSRYQKFQELQQGLSEKPLERECFEILRKEEAGTRWDD